MINRNNYTKLYKFMIHVVNSFKKVIYRIKISRIDYIKQFNVNILVVANSNGFSQIFCIFHILLYQTDW